MDVWKWGLADQSGPRPIIVHERPQIQINIPIALHESVCESCLPLRPSSAAKTYRAWRAVNMSSVTATKNLPCNNAHRHDWDRPKSKKKKHTRNPTTQRLHNPPCPPVGVLSQAVRPSEFSPGESWPCRSLSTMCEPSTATCLCSKKMDPTHPACPHLA